MRRAICLGVLAGILACGRKPWPEENRRAFVESCLHSAAQAVGDAARHRDAITRYCDCSLQRMEEKFPLAEVDRLEALVRASGGRPSAEQTEAVADCARELAARVRGVD